MSGAVLLVGCGKMGGAMARGWLDRGLTHLAIVEPNRESCAELADDPRVILVGGIEDLPDDFRPRTLVLAVKPQAMPLVLPPYRRFTDDGALVISIAAGKTLGFFQDLFPGAAIVRAMPNLPASIGRGITVCVGNASVSAGQKVVAGDLLAACGEVAWVGEEALIDPVTALSGGGPAYVFLLIETLAKAGEAAGLPADLAMTLARVTVAGAGELVHSCDLPAATLRENVSSPGGTTLAALKVLMAEDGLQPLMTRAIAAATERSRELARPA